MPEEFCNNPCGLSLEMSIQTLYNHQLSLEEAPDAPYFWQSVWKVLTVLFFFVSGTESWTNLFSWWYVISSLVSASLLEKAMAAHSSTLAWKIPWMQEPGRLQSMGSQSQTQLSAFTFTFHFHALEKEMATHSSVLAWRIPGTGEPGGLPSMRSHRVGHNWSDLAAAASLLFYFFPIHSPNHLFFSPPHKGHLL